MVDMVECSVGRWVNQSVSYRKAKQEGVGKRKVSYVSFGQVHYLKILVEDQKGDPRSEIKESVQYRCSY